MDLVIVIQEYSLKRGFSPELERVIKAFSDCFDGITPEIVDDRCVASFGAMKQICFWFNGKKLCVDTVSAEGVSDDVILDTNRRFRKFLEKATGYTAKQRLEKAKKEVSK